MWVQSFELGNLVWLRTQLRFPGKLVFLATSGGAPYDLVTAGDPRTYADLLTATSLRDLAKTINGSAPTRAWSCAATPTAPSPARRRWSPTRTRPSFR
ncbi:MAG: hypothetical protein V9G19_17645 [Tetrasphaera sp.]